MSQQQQATTVVGVSAVAPAADTVVAPPSTHSGVVAIAMSQLGTPYVWAGCRARRIRLLGPRDVGVRAGRRLAAALLVRAVRMGVPVSRDQLEPGDLVFFDGLGHVGIYIGGGQFIHAPHTGDVVKISSLDEAWYSAAYVGARRIL